MATQTQTTQIPDWWYRDRRPVSDDAYFENLCRIIFQTGLNWQIVTKKWPTIRKAFCGFNVNEVADFTKADVKRLLNDKGIIRNPYKIPAIIQNAKRFQHIIAQCGSFQAYLNSLDKSGNYQHVVKELADTFDRIGPTTAALFLYTVGESINPSRFY